MPASDPFTGRTFTLSIEIGHAGMQTGYDVAEALRGSAYHVEMLTEMGEGFIGTVYDTNGTLVGRWEVKP